MDSCRSYLLADIFVVAVAAAIIASQAMISGAFAIITQSLSLCCFPRIKVVHTLAKYEGQVYIPEINYMLMVACVTVTLVFKTTDKIVNAYRIAVVAVMVITTCMVNLIMLVIWKTSIWWIASFFVVFGATEAVYLSSVLYKFKQGGFLLLAFSLVLMTVMGIWHYVHKQRYCLSSITRFPVNTSGVNKFHSHQQSGIGGEVSVQAGNNERDEQQEAVLNIQTSTLLVQDQKDDHDKLEDDQDQVHLRWYVHIEESLQQQQKISASASLRVSSRRSIQSFKGAKSSNSIIAAGTTIQGLAVEEMQLVQRAKENGVVYLLGEAEVVAKQNSPLFKRFTVNYAYSFLRKNFRQGEKAMEIPQTRLLREPKNDNDTRLCNSVNFYINQPMEFPGEEEPDASASLQNCEDMIKDDISSRFSKKIDQVFEDPTCFLARQPGWRVDLFNYMHLVVATSLVLSGIRQNRAPDGQIEFPLSPFGSLPFSKPGFAGVPGDGALMESSSSDDL
ncbi:hypothetical protein LguiA_025683 [Lonicera macranthoides]